MNSTLRQLSCGTIDVCFWIKRNLGSFRSLGLIILLAPNLSQSKGLSGSVKRLADATHIEFQGDVNWDYRLEEESSSNGRKIKIYVPSVSEDFIERLKSWKGPLISKVEVNPDGIDQLTEINFLISNKKVKAFDYLTDQPSRLIVDFYVDDKNDEKGPEKNLAKNGSDKNRQETHSTDTEALKVEKVAGLSVLPRKNRNKASRNKNAKKDVRNLPRKPAGQDFKLQVAKVDEIPITLGKNFKHGIYDGADPNISRFLMKRSEVNEYSVRASEKNMYLRFPRLDMGMPYLQDLLNNPPIYEIIPADNEENKLARLLLVLFEKRKVAMFTKTLNHFREFYPGSKYMEIVGYLEADLHYHLYQTKDSLAELESALAAYRVLIETYPNSPLNKRTHLLIGYSLLKRNDALGAIKIFQRLLKYHKGRDLRAQVELAVADGFLRLRRYKEAVDYYRKVALEKDETKYAIEAEFLKGDAHFRKADYKESIRAYDRALRMYPASHGLYPNAYFNRAESYFWEKDYYQSLVTHVEFLRRFPKHMYGGYSMTRVGELLDILGAPAKKSMGAFMESFFRFRSTEGGGLARVSILTGRMPHMKERQYEDAIKELNQIIEKSRIDGVEQFVKVKMSDGFLERREFDQATDILVKYYQQNPTTTQVSVFETRIVRNITEKIRHLVDSGENIEAIKEYHKYKDSWLKRVDRLDVRFFLARAYEKSGLYKEADDSYREVVNTLYSIKGTEAEKTRNSFEKLPSADVVNLRLAKTSVLQNKFIEAGRYLRQIKKSKQLSESQQVELVEIAARVALEGGRTQLAKSFLSRLTETWKGQPEKVASPLYELAKLQMKTNEYTRARNSLDKLLYLNTDTSLVDEDVVFDSIKLKGSILEKQKRTQLAAETYMEALQKFEDKRDLRSLRYRTGKLYFESKKYRQAEKVWTSLNSKEDTWSRLARDRMNSVEWQDNYKKYTKRIPAMDGFARE